MCARANPGGGSSSGSSSRNEIFVSFSEKTERGAVGDFAVFPLCGLVLPLHTQSSEVIAPKVGFLWLVASLHSVLRV